MKFNSGTSGSERIKHNPALTTLILKGDGFSYFEDFSLAQ